MAVCIFKMKRVHFRLKENPFIPIYNQILGHTKKLKRVIPYLSFLSWSNNWMESGMFMKWWEKKNVDICPTIVYKCAWNVYYELVKSRSAIWSFFFGPNSTLFLCKNRLLWVISEKEAVDYRKNAGIGLLEKYRAGGIEGSYTRKEVKLKPFLCQRIC